MVSVPSVAPGEPVAIDGFQIRYGFAEKSSLGGFEARGGGILLGPTSGASSVIWEVELANLTVRNNIANDSGGGLAGMLVAAMQMSNCTFRNNNAGRRVVGGFAGSGGGVFLERLANTSLEAALGNSRFIGNQAPEGGGISLGLIGEGRTSLFNCLFHDNTAYEVGGGIHYLANSLSPSTGLLYISHTTVTDNHGGGVYLGDQDSDPANNTPVTLASSILYGNRRMDGGVSAIERDLIGSATGMATLTARYSDIRTGTALNGTAPLFPGTGNINAAPQFKNAANDNFRLNKDTSPCIDAADDLSIDNAELGDVADVDLDGITTEFVQIDLDGDSRENDITTVTDTGLDAAVLTEISDMGCFENNEPADAGGGGPAGGGNV